MAVVDASSEDEGDSEQEEVKTFYNERQVASQSDIRRKLHNLIRLKEDQSGNRQVARAKNDQNKTDAGFSGS